MSDYTVVDIKPKPEFYTTFSAEEIKEIINSLEVRKEIFFKYCYNSSMARAWNDYTDNSNTPGYSSNQRDIKFLSNLVQLLRDKQEQFELLNIIDIGQGNSYPVKDFLIKLQSLGWLNKYIAIDISEDMLDISRKNLQTWLPALEFQGYKFDIENSSFAELIDQPQRGQEDCRLLNIFLYLGGTICNHKNIRQVLHNIKNSMNSGDLLMLTGNVALYNLEKANIDISGHIVSQAYEYIVNLLGINLEDCELVGKFDSKINSYVANIRLARDYILEFNLEGNSKKVSLSQGEEINIYQYHYYQIDDQIQVPELIEDITQCHLQPISFVLDLMSASFLAINEAVGNKE